MICKLITYTIDIKNIITIIYIKKGTVLMYWLLSDVDRYYKWIGLDQNIYTYTVHVRCIDPLSKKKDALTFDIYKLGTVKIFNRLILKYTSSEDNVMKIIILRDNLIDDAKPIFLFVMIHNSQVVFWIFKPSLFLSAITTKNSYTLKKDHWYSWSCCNIARTTDRWPIFHNLLI